LHKEAFQKQLFLEDLNESPLNEIVCDDQKSIDDMYLQWSSIFSSILDYHAPLKQKRVRGDQLPWVTPDLVKQIRYRNKLYKKYRKLNSIDNFEKYRALKRQIMRQYLNDSTTNAKHPDFWKKLKPLLPSKNNPSQNIILVES
jgi:hypothetical protein